MRVKLIGLGMLLCIALALTVFCGIQIVRAVGGLQTTRTQASSGDVRTVRPWMTLHYISRVYHVPESFLLQSLNITDPSSARRTTLSTLAARLGVSPATLIQETQTAILDYRAEHPSPSATPHSAIPPPARRARVS